MNPLFADTESFPNYWLLKASDESGREWAFRCIHEHGTLSGNDVNALYELLRSHTVITFNGLHYDQWMIAAALNGWSAAQLHQLNDAIIVERRQPWQIDAPRFPESIEHIDLMGVAPGKGGQKMYAGRIHSKTMLDNPYDPTRALSLSQMCEVDIYCTNDITVLRDLYNGLQPHLTLRRQMSAKYGINLMSKSDPQIAEAVITHECAKVLGLPKIQRQPVDYSLRFKFEMPAYISFKTEALQRVKALVEDAVFSINRENAHVLMPDTLKGLQIPFGSSTYAFGIGGLHSTEKCVAHFSDAATVIRDCDVASYYPSLILNSGKYPASVGKAFAHVYGGIKAARLEAKHGIEPMKARIAAGERGLEEQLEVMEVLNSGGKIMINGTFGLHGSGFSPLRAPEMLIQTTVSGQLSILMLIEMCELEGIPVVSANTDGIVVKCPRHLADRQKEIVHEWERVTGLEMEFTDYDRIYMRDVNSYIAFKSGSHKAKAKGVFGKAGLDSKRNPNCDICAAAVVKYLEDETPMWATIGACDDIRQFVTVRKATGGCVKLWGEQPPENVKSAQMEERLIARGWTKVKRGWWTNTLQELRTAEAYALTFPEPTREYLGVNARWYYADGETGAVVDGKSGNRVGGSYGAKPCMVLPEKLPADIDYSWYIARCEELLVLCGAKTGTVVNDFDYGEGRE